MMQDEDIVVDDQPRPLDFPLLPGEEFVWPRIRPGVVKEEDEDEKDDLDDDEFEDDDDEEEDD